MAINKVTLSDGTNVLDISNDTLVYDYELKEGVTAHNKNGELILGTLSGGGGEPSVYLSNITVDDSDTRKFTITKKTGNTIENFTQCGISTGTGEKSSVLGYGFAEGEYSLSEGSNTSAKGDYSHAEGYYTAAKEKCSHAEGSYTMATGYGSHAEGSSYTIGSTLYYNNAEGIGSHAEGYYTYAPGDYSHAEGEGDDSANKPNEAGGLASHVEGKGNYTKGNYSHVEGRGNNNYYRSTHVEGEYNKTGQSPYSGSERYRGQYLHIAGNGTSDNTRSNAYTLDWEGNAWFAGKVYIRCDSETEKTEDSYELATIKYVDNKIGEIETALAAL